jgi:hypothetical protein
MGRRSDRLVGRSRLRERKALAEKITLEDLGLGDETVEELLAWYENRIAQKKLRRDNPYLADLIRALLPGPSHRSWVIDAMEKRRKSVGLPIPAKFDAAVQSVYNRFCGDSDIGPSREAALFYSPQGKGSGYWAVHSDRAQAWLSARKRQG